MLRLIHSDRSAKNGASLHIRHHSRSLDSLAYLQDDSEIPETSGKASWGRSASVCSLVEEALSAFRLGSTASEKDAPSPSIIVKGETSGKGVAEEPLAIGEFFAAGCDGELFETNVAGFLLKKTDPYVSWSPQDERGGEVECFQAIHGEDSARWIDAKSMLIRQLPGVNIVEVDGQLDMKDAQNFLKKVSEMHSKGIVHRDITSEYLSLVKNVLFDRETREFFIIDFGASCFYTAEAMTRPQVQAEFANEYANVERGILDMVRSAD